MPHQWAFPSEREIEHAATYKRIYQLFGVLSGALDWELPVHLRGSLEVDQGISVDGESDFSDDVTFDENVLIGGDLQIGVDGWTVNDSSNDLVFTDDSGAERFRIGDSASTYAVDVSGPANVDGALTVDSLAVEGSAQVDGNTTLGNGNGDTLTVVGVSTFRNADSSATQLYVDAGNNRVIVGSTTALGSDVTPSLHVVGRTYIAPPSPGNDQSLFLRHSPTAGQFSLGASNSADPSLIFKDHAGDQMVVVNPSGSTYALDVNNGTPATNAARFTGDVLVVGDLATSGGSISGTSITASDTITAADGITVSSGGINVTGASEFQDSVEISTGGLSVDGASLFEGGLTVQGGFSLQTGTFETANVQHGFFGSSPINRPTVSGSRGGNAALTDLLSELANLGLITNSTSA